MRANVFIGFKKILTKERSHRIIKDFLPNFANEHLRPGQRCIGSVNQTVFGMHKIKLACRFGMSCHSLTFSIA